MAEITNIHNRIDNDFMYHPPATTAKAQDHEDIRFMLGKAAHRVAVLTPPGREQSLALTHIEEAMFWANAAIARSES